MGIDMVFRMTKVRSFFQGAAFVICLSLIASLPGCGGGADKKGAPKPRVNVSGKVEFDGKPVPAGTVTFINATTGDIATCKISDGSYSNARGEGPNSGDCAVTIVGMDKADGTPLWGGAWTKQVKVGEKDFKEDFSIKSSDVKPFNPKSRPVDD